MEKIISILVALLLSSALTYSQPSPKKIKVYLLGTFHFTQPDSSVYDVRSAKNQKCIQELSDIIAGLGPDKIFI